MADKEKDIKPVNNKKSKKEEKNKRHFFKDFKAELKRVVWPTPKQLLNSTIAVITIVLVIGVVVFLLDMGFEILNKQNAKLQSSLQEKISNSAEETNTTSNNDEASGVESNVEQNTTNTAE